MELHELTTIRDQPESLFSEALPEYCSRVSVDHPDSPNPWCFFEVDETCFAQGSFWANNEYRIEAMNTAEASETMNETGSIVTVTDAMAINQRFCRLPKAKPNS